MPIKILLADDSDAIRSAIRKILEEEPAIAVVGEASTFAQTMQMIGDLKPTVLLFDLYMPEKRNFQPDFVKSQLAFVDCILAMSLSNDSEAKTLAESYGAKTLLDKMHLYDDMIPAIIKCSKRTLFKTSSPHRQQSEGKR